MACAVNIAVYKPFEDDSPDPDHWALHFAGYQDVILQVADNGFQYYVDSPVHNVPSRSQSLRTIIAVGRVEQDDRAEAIHVVQSTPVNNTSDAWNCQSWVMEALQRLVDRNLIYLNEDEVRKATRMRQTWQ